MGRELRGLSALRRVDKLRVEFASGEAERVQRAARRWLQGLPQDYYQQYPKAVAAITKDDVLRVAKKYVDLDHLAIVIVGDKASIEGPLKTTGIAPISLLDDYGVPKTTP